MSKCLNTYFEYSKEKINKNIPKTPCIKNNLNKEEKNSFNNSKSRSGSKNKSKSGKSNSKKKCKINYDLFLDQDNHYKKNNCMFKNFCSKNILNINNACNNDLTNKTSYFNNKNNNISSNNFYNKKINYIINYDNLTKSNNEKNNTDFNNFNLANKTHSLIHNNSGNIYNKSNYNVNTTKNAKDLFSKKNITYINSNKKPYISKSKNKINDDIKSKNKGKPISLLETSKNQNNKFNNNTNYNNKTFGLSNSNIIHIKKGQYNNFNNYNCMSTNHFFKKNFLSNNTYTNENCSNNNLHISNKNDLNQISKKFQMSKKIKKIIKRPKAIKKSQSQSHFNYKKSKDLNSKNLRNKSNSKNKSGNKSRTKNKSRISNLFISGSNQRSESKKKNIIKNPKLYINNTNNYTKFNYNNIIKPSSQNKNYNLNKKHAPEESKSILYNITNYNNYSTYYNKINRKIFKLEHLAEEYVKDPLLNEIKDLWEEIGGISTEYKEQFINCTKQYENRNEIFKNEINELTLIKNNLAKLNNDIKKRNEIVDKIKNINDSIDKNNYEEIKNLLIALRIITIDIIDDYILFFKEISYDILMNKFDINKIKNFNKYYLNEIQKDTNFLKYNSNLNKVFSFLNYDPFLINPSLSKINENQQNKYIALPIDKDTLQKITKYQYILLKEKIFENIGNNIYNYIHKGKDNNNDIINDCINSCRQNSNNINMNDNNISRFIISNKSQIIKNSANYKSYKCNDFCYINNKKDNQEKINTPNENSNKAKNNINFLFNKSKANTNTNKTIENISKIMNKIDYENAKEDIENNSKENNISPIQQNSAKKEVNIFDDSLKIIPFNKDRDSSLSLLYSKYLSSVNENMKQSFNINNDIFYYSSLGLYPKILLFKDNNYDIKAICTLSFNENLNMDRKILLITSISCTKEYKISKILLNLLDFCKNNEIIFDSIEINLYYIKKEDGKFILDEELEKEIKKEAKFKWVRLENDGEKRKIKYHYIPSNIITNKENSILNNINLNNNISESNNYKYAIYLNNYALIRYFQTNGINNISKEEYSKLFFVIYLFKKYYLLNSNKQGEEIQNFLNNLNGIKLKKIIRILSEYNNVLETNILDFKKDYCSNDSYNIELLYTFLEIIEKSKNNSNSGKNKGNFICLNFFNISTNFSNIIKIEIDGYEYNIILMNDYIIEVFNINDVNSNFEYNEAKINTFNIYDNNDNYNINNKNQEQKEIEVLYFTKSESDNISFLFYEVKDDNNIINENDIRILFNKILKKILIKDSEEPIKSYKKICLPSFSFKKRNNEEENKAINKNENLKLIECDILDCNESFDFCIENIPNYDIKFSFPLDKNIEESKEIKIIKNNFVVAVINNDLILDYQIPSMSIYYISKDKWIKVK